MVERTAEEWVNYSEALAFLGNSLLSPMNQTGTVGLAPEFWDEFPTFGSDAVAGALGACRAYAEGAQAYQQEGGDPVRRASVEYTMLFIGLPSPAAAPWETMHRTEGASAGFGEPTFDMQRLLREAGLQVSNENNQYADHIGIELLYASVLCRRIAEADDAAARDGLVEQLRSFAAAHPLGWVDKLISAVKAPKKDGYIASLLDLAKALLESLM